MDYGFQINVYPDPEIFDSLEDTQNDTMFYSKVFTDYCTMYLTLDGLYFLYENMEDIYKGITGDGCLVLSNKINKISDAVIQPFNYKNFVTNCISYHVLIGKTVTHLGVNYKTTEYIDESTLSTLLKSSISKIFGIEIEPSFSHLENFYDILTNMGYIGRFRHD